MFGGKREDFHVRPPPKNIEERIDQTIDKIHQEAEPLIQDAMKKVDELEIKEKM